MPFILGTQTFPDVPLELRVSNVYGQVVYTTQLNAQQTRIDKHLGASGLYLIEVINPSTGTRQTETLMVK